MRRVRDITVPAGCDGYRAARRVCARRDTAAWLMLCAFARVRDPGKRASIAYDSAAKEREKGESNL